jgi:hypothetical protein
MWHLVRGGAPLQRVRIQNRIQQEAYPKCHQQCHNSLHINMKTPRKYQAYWCIRRWMWCYGNFEKHVAFSSVFRFYPTSVSVYHYRHIIRRCKANITVESSSNNQRINLHLRVHKDIHIIAFHGANAKSDS